MFSAKGNVAAVGKAGNGGLSIEVVREQLEVSGIVLSHDELVALLCEHGWARRDKAGVLVPTQFSLERGFMLHPIGIAIDDTDEIQLRSVPKLTGAGLDRLSTKLRVHAGDGLDL